jgi:mono/diheme cytochrome c family protein
VRQSTGVRLVIPLVLAACGSDARRPEAVTVVPPTPTAGAPTDVPIPASPQRPGDPKKGWDALTGEGYVGCGVPRSLWDTVGGMVGGGLRIDRPRSADLPYFMNAAKMPNGVEIVTANCLGCHASFLRGKLVIGLGEVSTDFQMSGAVEPLALAGMMVGDKERAELSRMIGRMKPLEKIRTHTAAANPADHIAAVLFAHRDPKTLAWSDEPLIPIAEDEPVIPVDVPAWWLLKKKSAMFHTGAGRGDQARIMMTASVFCVDDVATAKQVDSYFPDIRAYLLTLEPPKYPGTIDLGLVATGKQTFEAKCSKCHGTYGEGGKYQSKIVALDKIGTDPKLAQHAGQFAAPFTQWFNSSFYGEIARLEPGVGYVPPPLDGVWATAPYFHNGSVPNLAAVLDSSLRKPRTAIVRGRDAYDLTAVGWPNRDPDDDTSARWIYDTKLPGYANTGHTFGDKLSASERAAVIEYLKTL